LRRIQNEAKAGGKITLKSRLKVEKLGVIPATDPLSFTSSSSSMYL
jgi:hypothetical protein